MLKYEYVPRPIVKLGRVVTGKTPPTKNPENYGGDIKFVTPSDLHDSALITKTLRTISEQGLSTVKKNSLSGLSIVVGCIGWDMGNVRIVDERCVTNQQINSITDFQDDVNPYYLYYWLSTKKQYLRSIATVTRTPLLPKSDFSDVEVPLPPKGVQDKVASFLWELDKKRNINSSIIEKINQIISLRYIYDYGFKNHNGTIGDILVKNAKSTILVGDAEPIEKGYPFFTSGSSILKWTDYLVDGTNVFMNTGGLAGVKFYAGKAAYSTDTLSVKGKDSYSYYLYTLLKAIEPEINSRYFQGTGLKHLDKDLLLKRPIYIPKPDELNDFNKSISPLLDIISGLDRENQNIDAMLTDITPLLLNGQILLTESLTE